MILRPIQGPLRGEVFCPGDKSVSHRSIILLSISKGNAQVENLLVSEDVLTTISIFEELGVNFEKDLNNSRLKVYGRGLDGLRESKDRLYCGNSGTTMRLLAGLLSGQKFESTLTGDSSLSQRPMDRIVDPLRKMGRKIEANKEKYPPLTISPSNRTKDFLYELEIASAQVKSSLLLSGLYSEARFKIRENYVSRDHTERMLDYLSVDIDYGNGHITLGENRKPYAKDIIVPGDISSASFLIVAALIVEGSNILIKNVGLNESRLGILNVIKRMGGNVKILNKRLVNNEVLGDVEVKYSKLKPVTIYKEEIGTMVDEIPIIAVAAAFADGDSYIYGLEELKYKETDRLNAIVNELRKANVLVDKIKDGIIVRGNKKIKGTSFNSYGDHRMAMALSILALKADEKSYIDDISCINISYPNFYDDFKILKTIK